MSLESKIQFRKYFVNRIDFSINNDFTADDNDLEFEFDIDNNINLDKENCIAVVTLTCNVFPDYIDKNQPFHLTVEISALFTFHSEDKDSIDSLICTNAVAILFPYLRSTLTTITGTTGFPPIILPTININAYLSNKDKEPDSNCTIHE